jgi:hypothetical protein
MLSASPFCVFSGFYGFYAYYQSKNPLNEKVITFSLSYTDISYLRPEHHRLGRQVSNPAL